MVDDEYLRAATQRDTLSPPYGYQWWLNAGSFSALGINGQEIRVYPNDDLVIVTHALSGGATDSFKYAGHVLDAIREALRAK